LTLAIQPGQAVQTLLLPLQVYRGTRDGHPDLALFDPRGEPVPFALRNLRGRTRHTEEKLTVPLFPLRQLETQAPGSPMRMQIRRDDAGTIVDVAAPGIVSPRTRTKVVGYVLDASKLEHAFDRVELVWDAHADGFQVRVRVEGSEDLANWQLLSPNVAVVGELRHEGHSIEQREIPLHPTRSKYLRVVWEGNFPVALRSAQLHVERSSVEQAAPRVVVSAQALRAADHEYRADLGGSFPLTAITPRVPENTLVVGSLSVRQRLDQPLTPLTNGQFYRVHHAGVEFVNPPLEIALVPARYISLTVDPRTDAIFNALAFEVEYAPEQLLFVTRGEGAYVLAFGSYRAAPPSFEADQLLAFLPEAARRQLPTETARAVDLQALAGESARREPLPPHSYRMQVLWGVLILGAGLLVVLAFRLLRKMER
ncbi:MAG TPA: DUF3999 domain-containing protein, partial [Polyangiales bacterium]